MKYFYWIYFSKLFIQVSWVRLSDWHILTTGVVTYTKDDRISVLYKEGSLDWILKVEDRMTGCWRDDKM